MSDMAIVDAAVPTNFSMNCVGCEITGTIEQEFHPQLDPVEDHEEQSEKNDDD